MLHFTRQDSARIRPLPRGDGHPVIVVPGLLTSNGSTLPMRRFLRARGFDVTGWRRGVNLGAIATFDAFADEVAERASRVGRAVSLIGWSLGGIAVRWAAHKHPDAVRQVITMGSPILADPRVHPLFPLYLRFNGSTLAEYSDDRIAAINQTPKVPATAIASRRDAIIPFEIACQPPSETAETIEVSEGHAGLGLSPRVWRILADRLAQPEGAWAPYAGSGAR